MEQPLLRKRSARELRRQHTSHWHVPSHARRGGLDARAVRLGFVRKVYAILTAQLLVTCAICAVGMYFTPVRTLLLRIAGISDSWWFQLALFLPTLVALAFAHSSKTSYPGNYMALLAFTVCMSFDVALVCVVVYESGLGVLLFIAAGITAFMFGSLTLYTFVSGRNFSFMGSFLFSALSMLCLWGLVTYVFGIAAPILYPLAGILVFCGYIVYDTWRITTVFGCDDYIAAAIELYLDILNLFLYILQLLLEIFSKSD